jgi:uncharacterized protein (TIGR03086 family)
MTPDDPRVVFAKAVAAGSTAISGVTPDQFDRPTPCDDFDVHELLAHLVHVLKRVARLGRGEDPFTIEPITVPDDEWLAAWREAAHDVQSAWTDDGTLEKTITLPWATLSGAEALGMYTNEIVVHVWDLATATGQRPDWDDQVLDTAFASIQRDLPAEGRAELFESFRQKLPAGTPFKPPYGAAVAVPAGAPLINRLVAYNGRTPLDAA